MTEPYIPRTQKGAAGNALIWIVGIIILCAAITAAVWGWRYATASTAGKVSARQQIQSGASRITAYDHFFNLCAAVQTDESRLDAQNIELATATGDDVGRIQANIAGITADRAEAINEYNADARKSYTIGQFRSSSLPYQLPVGTYTKEAPTSCVTGK